MLYFNNNQKEYFFNEIKKDISVKKCNSIVLIHLMPDWDMFLDVLNSICPIAKLIIVPYSVNQPTLVRIMDRYPILAPMLSELMDVDYMLNVIESTLAEIDNDFILIEIGGYFAAPLAKLSSHFKARILGSIEDTEAGHRRYREQYNLLGVPVVTTARSPLKASEDAQLGYACVHSFEALMRPLGYSLFNIQNLVMGYGKVGASVSSALSHRGLSTYIYDTNPIRCVQAIGNGHNVVDKKNSLKKADIVWGATALYSIRADDFSHLKPGAVLVSCSSKRSEFEVEKLDKEFTMNEISPAVTRYDNGKGRFFYLINHGEPVNFIGGNVLLGSVLCLVQAELLISINLVIKNRGNQGIFENSLEQQSYIADLWLKYFGNEHRS